MTTQLIISGTALVVLLLTIAAWFAWRQGSALFRLRQRDPEPTPEEERFLRRQIWRRLICSALMGLIAVLLAGALIFLEGPTQQLADQGVSDPPTQKERALFKLYSGYWMVVLLLLLGLLFLAGMDFWATRRFGLRQLRQLQADRKAMIEQEAQALRDRRRRE